MLIQIKVYLCSMKTKTTTSDNILFSIVTIAGMYGCLYLLLGTLSLVELFLGLR